MADKKGKLVPIILTSYPPEGDPVYTDRELIVGTTAVAVNPELFSK